MFVFCCAVNVFVNITNTFKWIYVRGNITVQSKDGLENIFLLHIFLWY